MHLHHFLEPSAHTRQQAASISPGQRWRMHSVTCLLAFVSIRRTYIPGDGQIRSRIPESRENRVSTTDLIRQHMIVVGEFSRNLLGGKVLHIRILFMV